LSPTAPLDPQLADLLNGDPADTLLLDDLRPWTRGELRRAAGAVCEDLRRRGVGPGARVAVHGPSEGRLLAAMLGARAAGALVIAVPRSPDPAAWVARWRPDATLGIAEVSGEADLRPTPHDGLCVALPTSGTTGEPKLVVLSSAAVRYTVDTGAGAARLLPGERTLVPVPLHHIYGWLAVAHAWRAGGVPRVSSRLVTAADVAEAARDVDAISATIAIARALQTSPRLITLSGEPVPAAVRLELAARHPRTTFALRYGMTELGGRALMLDPARFGDGTDCLGEPPEGIDVRIDEHGELWCRSPGMATCYLDDPEATSARWVDGWLRSGDRFERRPDGYYLVGRMDQRFKRRGEWVSPERIEAALAALPGVRASLVLPEERGGELVPVAWVEGEGLEGAALRRALLGAVAPWDVPAEVHVVAALARTGLGKVARARPTRDRVTPATGCSVRT
jgi:acyl-CoA synthetase (AMP-forming)/AMP-acid ligase II